MRKRRKESYLMKGCAHGGEGAVSGSLWKRWLWLKLGQRGEGRGLALSVMWSRSLLGPWPSQPSPSGPEALGTGSSPGGDTTWLTWPFIIGLGGCMLVYNINQLAGCHLCAPSHSSLTKWLGFGFWHQYLNILKMLCGSNISMFINRNSECWSV